MKAPALGIFLLIPVMGAAPGRNLCRNARTCQKIESAPAGDVADTNKACDSDIKASFDWPIFKPDDPRKYGVAGYCANALSAARQVCGISGDRGRDVFGLAALGVIPSPG